MFINNSQPQTIWGGSRGQSLDRRSCQNTAAAASALLESQLRDQVVDQKVRQLLLYYSQNHQITHKVIRDAWSAVLSQQPRQVQGSHLQHQYRLPQRQQNMMDDESKYFPHMADSGDECYLVRYDPVSYVCV